MLKIKSNRRVESKTGFPFAKTMVILSAGVLMNLACFAQEGGAAKGAKQGAASGTQSGSNSGSNSSSSNSGTNSNGDNNSQSSSSSGSNSQSNGSKKCPGDVNHNHNNTDWKKLDTGK